MSRWDDCLREFSTKNATDCLIGPNQPVRFKEELNWVTPSGPVWTPEECDQLCLQLLSEDEKHRLANNRQVQFYLPAEGSVLRGLAFVESDGFSFHFRRHFATIPTLQDLSIPRAVAELIQAPGGIVIMTGGDGQGKSTTAASILQHEIDRSFRATSLVEWCREFEVGQIGRIQIGRDVQLEQLPDLVKNLRPMQVVSLDIGDEVAALESAMIKCASGGLSLLILPYATVSQAISAVFSHLRTYPQYYDYFHDYFRGAVGQILVPAREGGRLPCFEICVSTPAIREILEKKELGNLEKIMAQSGESTGMRSLNQSLLQMVLRRKVDMKVAFQYSRKPEELDQMLNKAGI